MAKIKTDEMYISRSVLMRYKHIFSVIAENYPGSKSMQNTVSFWLIKEANYKGYRNLNEVEFECTDIGEGTFGTLRKKAKEAS